MKYIVEVREPVPSNLDEIAGKVAASFHISNDKALALLRRAPGAVTKAVSEREAGLVAGIFERAGLQVVQRPVEEAPSEPQPADVDGLGGEGSEPAAGAPAGSTQSEPPEAGPEQVAADREEIEPEEVEPGHGEPFEQPDEGDVWSRPVGGSSDNPVDAFSRRESFEQESELDWGGAAPERAVTPSMEGFGMEEGAPVAAEGAAEEAPSEDGIELDEEDLEVEGATQGGPSWTGAEGEDEVAGGLGAEAAAGPGAMARQRWSQEAAAGDDVEVGEVGEVGTAAEAVGDAGRSSGTPEMGRSSQTPEMVRRSQTPETMKSTLTEARADVLRRGGLRRRVALSSILPALLTLVVMAVAMLVTLLPQLRSQQQDRATAVAQAEAGTLEALTGGLPLSSQTLSAALVDLARGTQASLSADGVRLMVVTDATGAPLAGWYGAAITPTAMPSSVKQEVAGQALQAVAGAAPASESFTRSLHSSWTTLLAMLGLGSSHDVLAAAPVTSAGQAIGTVVVGVRPVSADTLIGNAFLTTILVGLVPVLIALLVALALTRGLRAQIGYLLGAADRISHGDLEEPVALDSQDELGQLARAIERMRVSLQEGLERLRGRR